MNLEIIISGIGGQGVLFFTKIISLAFEEMGIPFIGSEIHGMSQRGGSVVSHLKIGNFRGPLVREGRAHILFALEEGEAYRNLQFLRPRGKVYVVTSGAGFPVPEVKRILEEYEITVMPLDRLQIDRELFSSINLVLLGLYTGLEENSLKIEAVEKAIGKLGSAEVVKKNLMAFRKGIELSAKPPGC